MEKENAASADKQRRSKVYPRYGLESVMEFVRKIEAAGGDRIAKASVAAVVGIPSNSSAFLGRISSAKQFGLISVEGEKVSVTKRANRIFHVVSEDDKQAALNEALSEPSLYKELIKRYHGKTLPPTTTIGNVLMNDQIGIEKKACQSAASNFVQSAQYIGAVRNGMLVVPDADAMPSVAEVEAAFGTPQPSPQQQRSPAAPIQPVRQQNDDEFVFEFAGGVRLIVPKNTETSEAIADGELKQVRVQIKAFADKYLVKKAEEPKDGIA